MDAPPTIAAGRARFRALSSSTASLSDDPEDDDDESSKLLVATRTTGAGFLGFSVGRGTDPTAFFAVGPVEASSSASKLKRFRVTALVAGSILPFVPPSYTRVPLSHGSTRQGNIWFK